MFYWDQENDKITNERVSYVNTLNPNSEGINNTDTNMCTLWDLGAPPALQGLNSFSIPYEENQPTELRSCDSVTLPISLFDTNKFSEINLNNILISLHRMANFIRSRQIHGKTKKDLPIISEFGQAA